MELVLQNWHFPCFLTICMNTQNFALRIFPSQTSLNSNANCWSMLKLQLSRKEIRRSCWELHLTQGFNCASANEKRCKRSSLNIRKLNINEQTAIDANQQRTLVHVVFQMSMVQMIDQHVYPWYQSDKAERSRVQVKIAERRRSPVVNKMDWNYSMLTCTGSKPLETICFYFHFYFLLYLPSSLTHIKRRLFLFQFFLCKHTLIKYCIQHAFWHGKLFHLNPNKCNASSPA